MDRPDLSGHRILVLEDDFYSAMDTARALSEAGAETIGPFPAEDLAFVELKKMAPTGAVLDINLGSGPVYACARELLTQKIPYIFVTGYDVDVIPSDLKHLTVLQKPTETGKIIDALAGMLGERAA